MQSTTIYRLVVMPTFLYSICLFNPPSHLLLYKLLPPDMRCLVVSRDIEVIMVLVLVYLNGLSWGGSASFTPNAV